MPSLNSSFSNDRRRSTQGSRQQYPEKRSSVLITLDLNCAPVRLDNLLRNGEPESRSSFFCREERREELFLCLGVDIGPFIVKFEHQGVLFEIGRVSQDHRAYTDVQRSAGRRCFASVSQDVDKGFNELLAVCFDRGRRLRVVFDQA